MSHAGAAGQAGPAEAVTVEGTGDPPHVQLAYAVAEADAADERVERMRRKLAKAKDAAKVNVDTATAALAEAEAEAKAARARAEALAGEVG